MTLARFLISIYLAAPYGWVFVLGDNKADSADGQLTVVFSSVTPASWTASNLTQVFQAALSTVTNGYCARSTTTCSLKTWDSTRTFGPGNVVIAEGFPRSNGADLDVKFHITYPPGVDFSGDTKTVLAASTVKEIVLDKKEDISNAVGKSIKSVKNDMDANGDNEKDQKQTTNNRLNYIMIPLSVTLLIVLCLVTCCLQHLKNKRVKTLEAQRREQLKLKEEATPQPAKVEEQIGRVSEPRRKKRVKRKKKKRMQDEEMRSSDEAVERPSGRTNGTAVWFEDEECPHPRVKAKGNGQQWHKDLEGQDAREAEDLRTRQKDAVDGHQSETKDDVETDDMENDKLQKRKKKKKKKHRKRYTHPVDDEGYGGNGQFRTTVLSDSQLGKLPGIRNLPPLKERQSLET